MVAEPPGVGARRPRLGRLRQELAFERQRSLTLWHGSLLVQGRLRLISAGVLRASANRSRPLPLGTDSRPLNGSSLGLVPVVPLRPPELW